MSHTSHFKTFFKNLLLLQKALNALNLPFEVENSTIQNSNNSISIPQSNGHPIKFVWDNENKHYAMTGDISFWQQDFSVEHFMNTISEHYAYEAIAYESQKFDFEINGLETNIQSSGTLTIDRWRTSIL